MIKQFSDYFWDQGIPIGRYPIGEAESTRISYKIVMDPYRKHISVEKYKGVQFISTIYDSLFLDFRHLKRGEQHSWQKIPIEETPTQTTCLIRNQDDRIVYKEVHSFVGHRCKQCEVFSAQDIKLSTQQVLYTELGDAFNGVILFDTEGKAVLLKKYAINEENGEFSEMLQEEWDMENFSFAKKK
ncbi:MULTISPECIES: hypothetical protein [Parachlamydia]|jgi:hypothetical protein|uniref:Uncharacterized protein n=2 Tax=Parachlamydia acanthamoebae TaxID=83552 RepID=F8KZ00_PARAV|nr:hypothetical protein [Parachlamydia acanthamoebae]EFB40924.1 hypothetical protein pah_c178o026 [Parachlamydia acanthamoebae str. Hall's coccus]KIA78163.1 hypothetical protein DB43_EP00210 [Parachlamydia acanthamoebae]CCB86123.1 putative uncharacterized protein [Parachlamydia acanthamoebae UV-7]